MKLKFIILMIVSYGFKASILAQEQSIMPNYLLGGSINFFTQKNTYPLTGIGIISGIGGIYSNRTNDTKNLSFSFSPYFGKIISEKWLAGLLVDFRIGKYEAANTIVFPQGNLVDFERNSKQIGFGIFGRYILNPSNMLKLYLQPSIQYYLLNEKEKQNTIETEEEKANYIEIGSQVGVLYMINGFFNATMRIGGLNYINGNWKIVGKDTENDFSSFNSNFNVANIYFGLEYKF